MTICHFRLPLIVLALALPAPTIAQSVQDFQLPPAPAPSASPQVEGPVDTENGVVPVRPRVIQRGAPTPAPPARATQPAPAQSAPDRTAATPSPAATPTTRTRIPQRRSEPAPAGPSPIETPLDRPLPGPVPTDISETPASPAAGVPPQSQQPAGGAPATPSEEPDDESSGWIWLLLVLLLGVAVAAGTVFWRRRHAGLPPPVIEKPRVPAAVGDSPASRDGQSLSIQATALRLDRSFLNATLHYRLTLINRAEQALSEIAVGADLVSAHGNAAPETQLAMPGLALEPRHRIARIAPGQQIAVEGQVQLPLAAAQIIRQGRAALLVPLLRLVVSGKALDPLARTFVIGQTQAGSSKLQPFRVDDQPQSYQPISQRALD